jgi:hypothetical protein
MRIPTLALAALALCAAPAAAQNWQSSYPEADNELYAAMREMLVQQDMLSPILEPLNEYFPVPRRVTIEIAECGRASSYYDDSRPAVGMCYELVEALAEELMSDEAGEAGGDVFAGAFAYILLHQVGHALIDQMDLDPSASRESAADQLAAVMASFSPDDAANAVMGLFALHEMELDWEDGGQLSQRRAQDMACLFYGSDPDAFTWLIETGDLPAGRAEGCAEEFQQVRDEWVELLGGALGGG